MAEYLSFCFFDTTFSRLYPNSVFLSLVLPLNTDVTQVHNQGSTFFSIFLSSIRKMFTNIWCMPGTVLYLVSTIQLQWGITTTWIISRFTQPTHIPLLSSISNCLLNIILTLMGFVIYARDCSEHIQILPHWILKTMQCKL